MRGINEVPAILASYGMSIQRVNELISGLNFYYLITLIPMCVGLPFVGLSLWFGLLGHSWNVISTKIMPTASPGSRSAVFTFIWLVAMGSLGLTGFPMFTGHQINAFVWALFAIKMYLFYRLSKGYNRYITFSVMLTLCLGVKVLIFSIPINSGQSSVIASLRGPFDKPPNRMIFGNKLPHWHNRGLAVAMEGSSKVVNLHPDVKKLLKDVNFPLDCVMVAENSEGASYRGNFVSEELFLGADLLNKDSTEELIAVVGHELGHRYYKDGIWDFFVNFLQPILLCSIAVFGILENPLIYEAFGFTTEPIAAALPISEILTSSVMGVLQPFKMMFSQYQEYRADAYSASLGPNMSKGLIKYFVQRTQVFTSSLGAYIYMSHPSAIDRIIALRRLQK